MNRPGTPTPAFLNEGLPGPHDRGDYREMTEPLPSDPGPSRRHCWVILPDGEPVPGLILEWRHNVLDGWAAQTAYAVDGVVITAWVEAENLRPAAAEGAPAPGDYRTGP